LGRCISEAIELKKDYDLDLKTNIGFAHTHRDSDFSF